MKKLFKKVKELYDVLLNRTKKWIPVAVNIVEGIKKVMDSEVDDVVLAIVKAAIPGETDDFIINKVKSVVEKWLPKILLELQITESIANIQDKNEQLKAILAKIKVSSDETQNVFYHGLASLILEKLSDGKITWSESVLLAEYYFKNIKQK